MEKALLNKVEQWKKILLDTSRRNPLINFRAYKRTTIKVVDEKPSEVFRQLVINQEKFDFDPIPDEEELISNEENLEQIQLLESESNITPETEEFME